MPVDSRATTDGCSWPADGQAWPAVFLLAVEKPLDELFRIHVITGTRCDDPLVQSLMQRLTFLVREAVIHSDGGLSGLQVDHFALG